MVSETNTIDWSATAAWIALAVSIVTPTISLLLNNIHQRKLKKLELKHSLRLESYHQMEKVFNDFLDNVSSKLHFVGSHSKEYELAYHKLFLYVPKEYWQTLKIFNEIILTNSDSDAIQEQYLKVTEILASLLQETQKQIPT